jgi:hypothetical protein
MAPVEAKGPWGFIKTEGTMAIPARYTMADLFKEGLAAVEQVVFGAGHRC